MESSFREDLEKYYQERYFSCRMNEVPSYFQSDSNPQETFGRGENLIAKINGTDDSDRQKSISNRRSNLLSYREI